jgi:23S rRNA (cytidine1920-2'-O)/16S rRNA (cytidine1409-2'-O)-methyltransferase
MSDSDPLRRYIEAGIALTQLTRSRAEAIVKELVKAGEVQREHAQERVDDLLDRSRKGTGDMAATIRGEIAEQLSAMGFATKADLAALEARLTARFAAATGEPATGAGAAARTPAAKPGEGRRAQECGWRGAGGACDGATGDGRPQGRRCHQGGQGEGHREGCGGSVREGREGGGGRQGRAGQGGGCRQAAVAPLRLGARRGRRLSAVPAGRRRLDAELVRRGLAPSREQARCRIEEGRVLVGGAPADKPSRLVSPAEPVEVLGPPPRFVSRGGDKLEAALERFAVDVAGRAALDAGASTGGFTDCLLQRGAASVVAVDVGTGQLHERVRADPRVTVLDRTNVRNLVLSRAVQVVVADLSFISLRTVAPALVGPNAVPGADVVVLVKPQFEAGRAEAARGKGVIRDAAVWRRVLEEVRSALATQGAAMMGAMVSPLTGADGNVEFLAHFVAHADDGAAAAVDLDAVVSDAGRA